MPRFYKTSSANPLQYMYQLDAPLIEKAIETNDKYIDDTIAQKDQLAQLANYDYLPGDEQDAKSIIQGYNTRIEELAGAIQKDPTNWRKQQTNITQLRNDLFNDYQFGAIGKQIGNFNKRKQAFADLDKQVSLYDKSGGTKGVS